MAKKSNISFGSYVTIVNRQYRFEREPDWYWMFRPTTTTEDLEVADWEDSWATTHPDAKPSEIVAVWKYHLSHSFGGTNITDDEGEPILKSDAKPEDVEKVLAEMPLDMLDELFKAYKKVSPLFKPVTTQTPTPIYSENSATTSETTSLQNFETTDTSTF